MSAQRKALQDMTDTEFSTWYWAERDKILRFARNSLIAIGVLWVLMIAGIVCLTVLS
jgi:hypothetical protein